MTSSDVLDDEKLLRPGRTTQIEHAIETMRDILSAGPKMSTGATETTGKLITDAIAKQKRNSVIKTRKPLSMMQKKQEEEEQEKAVQREKSINNNDSSNDKEEEKPWEPSKLLLSNQSDVNVSSSTALSTATTTDSSSSGKIFVPLLSSTFSSSEIINDFDSRKLDQMEQAKSNALAKRMDEMKPLPVFAGDQEAIDSYLGGYKDEESPSSSSIENTLQPTMKPIPL